MHASKLRQRLAALHSKTHSVVNFSFIKRFSHQSSSQWENRQLERLVYSASVSSFGSGFSFSLLSCERAYFGESPAYEYE